MKEEILKQKLNEEGFSNFKRFDGSLFVYSAFNNQYNKKRILKAPGYSDQELGLFKKEVKGLKRLNGLEGITSIVNEINLKDSGIDSNLPKHEQIDPYVLVKEYAKGNDFSGQYLNTEEQQKVIDLVENIHDAKFVDLDIGRNNFIYFPGKGLTFVDIFNQDTLDIANISDSREIDRLKKADLESLNSLFELLN